MDLDLVSDEDLCRSLRLCLGSDPTSLVLSAAEGYLLSRIDGHTPWRVLRETGGLGAEEVDICVALDSKTVLIFLCIRFCAVKPNYAFLQWIMRTLYC